MHIALRASPTWRAWIGRKMYGIGMWRLRRYVQKEVEINGIFHGVPMNKVGVVGEVGVGVETGLMSLESEKRL
jgi:hypothetical protein